MEGEAGDDEYIMDMTFDSESAAFIWYNSYAREHGFIIQNDFKRTQKGPVGEILLMWFVCSIEGSHSGWLRFGTRCKCNAHLTLKRDLIHGVWSVKSFDDNHNHVLARPDKQGRRRKKRMQDAWDEFSPRYSWQEEPEFERAELEALELVVGDGRAKAIRLSISLLDHITNRFSIENRTGEGESATVYMGTLPNGSRIAVKSILDSASYRNEVSTMTRVADHGNIVRLIGYCHHVHQKDVEYCGQMVMQERTEKLICMEYLHSKTLEKQIPDKFRGGLDWNKRYHIAKGICQALRHLHHEVFVVHGDIKPESILVDDNLVPKLSNFRFSRYFGSEGESSESLIDTYHFIGTLGYRAPEIIHSECWSIKSDIYSFGVTAMKLFVGEVMHDTFWDQSVGAGEVLAKMKRKLVREGAFSSWEHKYQQVRTCLEICYNCTDMDPDKRPTASEIIQMLDETESVNYLWQQGRKERMQGEASDWKRNPPVTSDDEGLLPVYSQLEEPEFERAELEALELVVGDGRAKAIRLSISLLKHITNGFSTENRIGAGEFATVYMGTLPNGSRIAVKRLHAHGYYRSEVSIMTRVDDHENIVRLIGYCHHVHEEDVEYRGEMVTAERTETLICMEYVHSKTLEKQIPDKFPRGLDWNQRYHIVKGICQGLRHLHHEVHIVHGDIKPDNILLEDNLVPKLFDFGLSRHFGGEGESLIDTDQVVGTRGYMAPEIIHRGCWSIKSDIYSFGVTAMKLLVGEDMYDTFWDESVATKKVIAQTISGIQVLAKMTKKLVIEGEISPWERKYKTAKTCLEICCNCMDRDPDKRPTASKIIEMLDKEEEEEEEEEAKKKKAKEEKSESIQCCADGRSSVGGGRGGGSGGGGVDIYYGGDDNNDISDDNNNSEQSEDEDSELKETDTIEHEPEPTVEFPPNKEELGDLDTNGETTTQEHGKPETQSKLPGSADLSKLKVLEDITDVFSHKKIIGKVGTFSGSHKAFLYKGEIPHHAMIAVKRLIGVQIPAEKFKREAEQFMILDHKNIVKVAGYCHDESTGKRLVQFKGKPLRQSFNGPEQLLCYEYLHNGSLREYLTGQGSGEIDWNMCYKLIKGTCAGLHYLHMGRRGCPIIHLNLSPSNVLLDDNNLPRITGFDFSKLIGEKNTKSMAIKINGQIAYLPPDFFHSKGTDLKYLATVDIYSLGLMILEIATRKEIKASDHERLIKSIEENWREESQIASMYTSLELDELSQVKLCIDIGLDCVKSKPEKRPTARDIMNWLDKGSKPVPVPRSGARGVPRPTVRTNIIHADNHTKEKENRMGFRKLFGRK